MTTRKYTGDRIEALFQRTKVRTKAELLREIGCGSMTLYRLLSRAGYLTSYNRNGRFYTLSHIPDFDNRGLWTYRGTRFSRFGTLTETIAGLVRDSVSGMTARELAEALGVNVAPSLCRLARQQRIGREKCVGAFRYFDSDPQQARVQKEAWHAGEEHRLPGLKVVVAVLVELIVGTHHGFAGLKDALSRKGLRITVEELNAVFEHYDIKKKLNWS